MNGMNSSIVQMPVIRTAQMSTLAACEVAEPGQVLPELVEPEPGLAGVAAGLVHDAPLAAGQCRVVVLSA
jgi:hypothetical protein